MQAIGDLRLPNRFWSKVTRESSIGCWLWTAAKTPDGYGKFCLEGRHRLAHRISYEALVASIPADNQLDHLCRNRACVNPDHLEAVTSRENTMRSLIAPASINARKRVCVRGHPFTPENTYSWRQSRICRACRADRRKAMREVAS